MIPAQVLVPIVSEAVSLARAQAASGQQTQLAALQLAARREAFLAEIEHRSELAAHQRTVLMRMIEATQQMNQAKLVAVMETFRGVLGLLAKHQEGLLEQQDRLTRSLTDPTLPPEIRVEVRRQLRQTGEGLRLIDEKALELREGVDQTLRGLDASLPPLLLR